MISSRLSKKHRAVIIVICSAFFYSFMNALVRLAGDLPSVQKGFFRNFVAFFVALALIKRDHIRFSGKRRNLLHLLIRSIAGTLGIFCNFYAIDHLVLANSTMLNKTSPFFTILFSIFMMGEKIKPPQLIMIIIAFLGCLFVIKPGSLSMEVMPALIGLMGGALTGLAYTGVRKLTSLGEKGPIIVLFFSVISCGSALPWLIFDYHPMSLTQIMILLLAGTSAALGQFCVNYAYTYAPAREISIYDYVQVVFAAIFGYFLFGEVSDKWSYLGYVVILAMAVLMYIYNKNDSD